MSVGAAIVLAAFASGAGFNAYAHQPDATTGSAHKISWPSIPALDPTLSTDPCDLEATAYAAAVMNLNAAQQAADTTYYAWQDCLDANGIGGSDEPDEPDVPDGDEYLRRLQERVSANTVSILE